MTPQNHGRAAFAALLQAASLSVAACYPTLRDRRLIRLRAALSSCDATRAGQDHVIVGLDVRRVLPSFKQA